MSATKLLVLGIVRMYGKAHGYQVRRELLSWNADKWANTKPGSIYHALKKMSADGLLTEVETETGSGPERVTYELTADGEHDFHDRLTTMLAETREDMVNSAGIQAATVFITELPRALAISLLGHRLAGLRGHHAAILDLIDRSSTWGHPGHVRALYEMWAGQLAAAVAWTTDMVARLESGEFTMADDEGRTFGDPRARITGAGDEPAADAGPRRVADTLGS